MYYFAPSERNHIYYQNTGIVLTRSPPESQSRTRLFIAIPAARTTHEALTLGGRAGAVLA
jgi:hypothetical protein